MQKFQATNLPVFSQQYSQPCVDSFDNFIVKMSPDKVFLKFLTIDKVFTEQEKKCVSLSEVSKTLGLYKKSMPSN